MSGDVEPAGQGVGATAAPRAVAPVTTRAAADRPAEVRDRRLGRWAYAYDALGRRVWKLVVERPGRARAERVAARRTRFVWAGERLVREVTEHAAWDDAGGWTIDAALAYDEALAAALLGGAAPPGAAWCQAEARDYA